MIKNITFVDFQNDFVASGGALTFDNGKGDMDLINRVNLFWRDLPRGYFANAVVTYDLHDSATYSKTAESKRFPLHCVWGTPGYRLAVDARLIHDKVADVQHLRKNTYDMWAGTIDTVRPDIAKTKEVVLFGVASDICNRAAIAGWLALGAQVTVLEDLTRGILKQTREVVQEGAFYRAVQRGQLKVMQSRAFLDQIAREHC